MRRKCDFPGCDGFGRNKGLYKGKTRFGRFCEKHHKKLSESESLFSEQKLKIKNANCADGIKLIAIGIESTRQRDMQEKM